MATADAKNFLDAVDTDPQLRTKLQGSLEQIITTAQEAGYNFSAADLRQELRQRWGMTTAPNYDQTPDTCFFG
jgi:predicted ribosomally synthesized peptide with nif11-like leader